MRRRLVSGAGEVVLTAGVLTLLFVVWQLYWTDLTSGRAQASTVSSLQQQWSSDSPTVSAPTVSGPTATGSPTTTADTALPTGDAFAILYVPRFAAVSGDDYAVPVVQGTGTAELQDGIGHYDGTALPGEVGNFAIAGHRVTYGKPFNLIAELRDGDAVVVATRTQWFTYRVTGHEIVSPQQVSVIAPVPDAPGRTPTQAYLTMTACHPMHSARQRYVVHALLESVTDRSAGPPASLAAVG